MAIALTRIAVAALLVSAFTLSACTEIPKTAEGFREQAASVGSVDNFEVNRPLRDVAASFRERASACLQDLQTISVSGPISRTMMRKYLIHPTVLVTDRKAELTVQALLEAPLKLYEEPANGTYVLVTRAFPIDVRRTRIEMYGSPFFYDHLHTAVKGWASGTSTACPDFS